jgi:Flp pilus assembly protein TadG
VPTLAILLVALMGFLGLAIDLAMVAVAKAQVQNAADLGALTAARSLTGDPAASYNQGAATTNAQNFVGYNYVLGQAIQGSQLQLAFGSYDYNPSTQKFVANFPPTSGVPVTAVNATVTASNLTPAFSAAFGAQVLPTVTATAQAVHRPRDIALVMDLSGSMRMGTCLGYDFYAPSRTTNNPDTLVPTFGAYSSSGAVLVGPNSARTSGYDNYTISQSNTTAPNSSYTRTYVNNLYQNNAYATPLVRAFDSYTSSDGGVNWAAPSAGAAPVLPPNSYATTPGGDVPLFKNGSSANYAQTVQDVVNGSGPNALWELDGYSAYSAGSLDTSGTGGAPTVWTQPDYSNAACQFNGYTQGPGYYGKTFFLWPPDPRAGAVTNTTTLKSYLSLLGLTNASDQTYLANNWNTWLGQGATGLTNLQNWLKGASTTGGPYKTTGPFVPGSNGKAPIYYAVCRLFNRAYPAGSTNGAFSADWRVRFFGTNDNTALFDPAAGTLLTPGVTYNINYNAILAWIAQSPNPFPQQLRAGRVKFYGSIPTQITGSWPGYGGTDQRFWKELIDYTLGFVQTNSVTYTDVSAMAGYGSDFTWGTVSLVTPPLSPSQYMNYTDNPARPLLRYWFGPLALVDFLNNYNLEINQSGYYCKQPGDSYEAPIYTAKEAYLAAINTIEKDHPNDWFSLVCYSWPRDSSSNSTGRFNCVQSPLGPNYAYGRAALFFPFATINADGSPNNTEITPYDADPATNLVPSADFTDTTRADGDTCFAMALMLAYNQFATTAPTDATLRSFAGPSPIAFPAGMAGGMGRKGAQKVIIFETDGLANCMATANLVNVGTYKYYQVRYDMNNPAGSEFPAVSALTNNNTSVLNQVYGVVQQLASDYGTSRNPFRLYAIGFGPVFSGPDASAALQTLQTMQYYAGTQANASTPLPANQVITGTDAQMSANMVAAFTNILQSGVQIALTK